jgi:hypothetical protein
MWEEKHGDVEHQVISEVQQRGVTKLASWWERDIQLGHTVTEICEHSW